MTTKRCRLVELETYIPRHSDILKRIACLYNTILSNNRIPDSVVAGGSISFLYHQIRRSPDISEEILIDRLISEGIDIDCYIRDINEYDVFRNARLMREEQERRTGARQEGRGVVVEDVPRPPDIGNQIPRRFRNYGNRDSEVENLYSEQGVAIQLMSPGLMSRDTYEDTLYKTFDLTHLGNSFSFTQDQIDYLTWEEDVFESILRKKTSLTTHIEHIISKKKKDLTKFEKFQISRTTDRIYKYYNRGFSLERR